MRLLQVTAFLLFTLSFFKKMCQWKKSKLAYWSIGKKKYKYSKFKQNKPDTKYWENYRRIFYKALQWESGWNECYLRKM